MDRNRLEEMSGPEEERQRRVEARMADIQLREEELRRREERLSILEEVCFLSFIYFKLFYLGIRLKVSYRFNVPPPNKKIRDT